MRGLGGGWDGHYGGGFEGLVEVVVKRSWRHTCFVEHDYWSLIDERYGSVTNGYIERKKRKDIFNFLEENNAMVQEVSPVVINISWRRITLLR
jgi:uncharacterized protein (DUF488 family)